MKKNSYYLSLLVLLVILPATQLLAQPMGGGLPCGTFWTGPCIPIDGGISFLIAAGVAYGGKKLYYTQQTKGKKAE